MVAPLRHRQTKGAATDMPGLLPPRNIPTLPNAAVHLAVPKPSPWDKHRAPGAVLALAKGPDLHLSPQPRPALRERCA